MWEERNRPLAGRERSELRQIIRSVDQAQRIARRIDNDQTAGNSRLPRPGEVGRLPGTGSRGGDVYTYTVVIDLHTPQAGVRDSFTHVITSPDLLPGEDIRAMAVQAAQRGEVQGRLTYPTRMPGVRVDFDVRIISVYRGSLSVE